EAIYSVESPIEHFYNHVIQLEPIESRLTQEDILNQLLRMDAEGDYEFVFDQAENVHQYGLKEGFIDGKVPVQLDRIEVNEA
ncbi:hypothetical protein PT076_08890, partial [Erysipelothrix rhusiopathiae]|nr:hypothetical protein [Erysipelothrix rhusiopathiae]